MSLADEIHHYAKVSTCVTGGFGLLSSMTDYAYHGLLGYIGYKYLTVPFSMVSYQLSYAPLLMHFSAFKAGLVSSLLPSHRMVYGMAAAGGVLAGRVSRVMNEASEDTIKTMAAIYGFLILPYAGGGIFNFMVFCGMSYFNATCFALGHHDWSWLRT